MSAFVVALGVRRLLKSRSKDSATRKEKPMEGKPVEAKPVEKKPREKVSKEVVADLKSKYIAPCACNSRQCCCTEHDSLRVPPLQSSKQLIATRHNTVQSWLDSSTLCGEADGEELHDEPPVSVPPSSWPDPTLPLLPMHWSVSDHLSFNKLASVRRTLGSPRGMVFVPELSDKGSILTDTNALFNWFCHVYFDKGSFEQRLRVVSQIHAGSPEHYIACPHQSLSVSEPTFGERNGHPEVQAWVTGRPPRCPSHPMERWCDLDGPYTHRTTCRICDVDVESTIDVAKGYFMRVMFTCRRGLGAGLDPSDPKWVALMTGKEHTNVMMAS
ncbi:hypothetical protein CCMA1212_008539 [Trichoderma ghanense]|uniref:Uncharacterized protein n=1 Tax=Trichoderma ghanense TaxID=65468 RepID=A0ABY2GWB4_9HYPO